MLKKINDYLERELSRGDEVKAARKKHWNNLPPSRKGAYYTILALGLGLTVFGAWTQMLFTYGSLGLCILMLLPLVVRWRRWRVQLAVNMFSQPIVLFSLSMFIIGLTSANDYDHLIRDQKIIEQNLDKVVRDASEFLEHFENNNLVVEVEEHQDDWLNFFTRKDPYFQNVLSYLLNLRHIKAPEDFVVSNFLSEAEIYDADYFVHFVSRDLMKRHVNEGNLLAEQHFAAPVEDIPFEDIHDFKKRNYQGISLFSCGLKNNGVLVTVSGATSGMFTNLIAYEAAADFVEICERVAKEKSNSVDFSARFETVF